MKTEPKPLYFSYLTQSDNPFFDVYWGKKLAKLVLDLKWIDELEVEDDCAYSRDFESDDFPTFWNWPQGWQDAHREASNSARLAKMAHLKSAEVVNIDGDELYILEDSEEVWFSTSTYANGIVMKMDAVSNDDIEFDSAYTAAYAYMNDYKEWDAQYGSCWKAANILSSADCQFSDKLVGTTQECDGCGAYTRIVKDDGNVSLCAECAK